MNGTLIATTPKHQMHALAYQGIIVMDSYPQLSRLLRQELGDNYVLLFAEPVTNPADNCIDWYTPVQGAVRALPELPAEKQNAVRSRLLGMAGEISRISRQLQNAQEQSRVVGGHILELALRYPDEKNIFLVGDQPVLVCWGFGPGTPGAEPQDLARIASLAPAAVPEPAAAGEEPAAPRPEPAPAPAPAENRTRGGGWLWWLLPLLLLLLLLWVLVTSFGGWPALSGTTWFHAPALPFSSTAAEDARLSKLKERNAATEQELAALKETLTARAAQCIPAAPAQKTPEEPQGEPLVLPEKKDDLAFLEGRWRCRTGLVNSTTKEPLVMEYVFDHNGKGTLEIRERNDLCRGTVEATFENGQLVLHASESRCQGKTPYNAMEIHCTDEGGAALCFGKSPASAQWKAQFSRLQ